jgi:hypothetical protein
MGDGGSYARRHIDRGIRRHLRCRDARGFISDDFRMETACRVSPASDPTADAKLRHSFAVAVLLSASARERLRPRPTGKEKRR